MDKETNRSSTITTTGQAPTNQPPFRTMPLSRSWDELPQDGRSTAVYIQPREEHASRKTTTAMQRTFHNTGKAAEDVFKSPDVNASASRLGITPPTVSTIDSTTPRSPPRYMTYRSSLAGRMQTPFRYPGGATLSPQKPLDPVILSFDRNEEEDSASNGSNDDEDVDDNPSAPPSNLYSPPPTNLQQRAYHYRLEDDPQVMPFEVDDSALTEPTSNRASLKDLPMPSEDELSSDEESQKAEGPGDLYLQVLKTKKTYPAHVPTPPRKFNHSAANPGLVLEGDEDDTESDQSGAYENPVQLSRSGEVSMFTDDDLESDQGSDLPPDRKRNDDHVVLMRRRRYCGPLFLCLALVLLAALLLFLFLTNDNWKPQFMKGESENRAVPTALSLQPTTAPLVGVPTSTREPSLPTTVAPTIVSTLAPTKTDSKASSTQGPSWDPVRTSRLSEAVQLLSAWGRFDLWDDPATPQAKGLYWWIGNSDWDLYSDERKIQRYVLAILFYATGGHVSWLDNTSWLTDEHECFWFTSSVGAVCNQETQLLEVLHLEQNQVRGMLPPEIALLTSLTEIRLVGNKIFGSLPVEWARLENLRVLELRDNMLAGGELPGAFSAWARLEILDLSNNRLGGRLPGFVAGLSQLIFLMLGGNGFSGPIPSTWSTLGQLRVLSLERNRLSGGVTESLAQGLVELRELHLATNFIDDFSPSAWQFEFLQNLDMSENRLNGTIPDELFFMWSLRTLNLADNTISGELSDSVGNLEALEDLNLSRNRLDGELPESLGDARDLRFLQLQNNQFTGGLPARLRQLRRIELLRLDHNDFTRVDNICRGLEDTLLEFYADCAPETGLRCPCCTHCCSRENGICLEEGGL